MYFQNMTSKDASVYLHIFKLFLVNMVYNMLYRRGFRRVDIRDWITSCKSTISKVKSLNVTNNFYLYYTSILSSKRSITPTEIDAYWGHMNLIRSTVKQSHMQNFQLNMTKHVEEKCRKMCISSILSSMSQKGQNSYKNNGNWRHSILI